MTGVSNYRVVTLTQSLPDGKNPEQAPGKSPKTGMGLVDLTVGRLGGLGM